MAAANMAAAAILSFKKVCKNIDISDLDEDISTCMCVSRFSDKYNF